MIEVKIPLGVSFDLGYLQELVSQAIVRLGLAMLGVVVAAVLLSKFLPKSRLGGWLVFQAKKDGATGLGAEAPGSSLPKHFDHLLHQTGVTLTVLRPTGVARFGDEHVDVVTEGAYVEKDARVEVLSVQAHRVVVRKSEKGV